MGSKFNNTLNGYFDIEGKPPSSNLEAPPKRGQIVGHMILPAFHGPGIVLALPATKRDREYLVYWYRSAYYIWLVQNLLYEPNDIVIEAKWQKEILIKRSKPPCLLPCSISLPAALFTSRSP